MGGRYAFDIETNGFLADLNRVFSLCIECLDTGKRWSLHEGNPAALLGGIKLLFQADLLVGHNIIGFDIPALQKCYPYLGTPKAIIRDTHVLGRLMWPHIGDSDWQRVKAKQMPAKLANTHKLEAWGYRLGVLKDEYQGGFEAWSEEMQAYCEQDVTVTVAFWRRIEREAVKWGVPLEDPNPPPGKDCVELEHRVTAIVEKVMRHGFRFNEQKAVALLAKITARKAEVEAELQKAFPPREETLTFVPKANNKRFGYKKGVPFTKRWQVTFNPGSRQEVGRRLQMLGWKPQQFGKDGYPTVDDDILQALPYPEAKVLAEWYMLDKRVGQISAGKEAWLKKVKQGRIHGRIIANGAHTGRMTHSGPNVAQVPGNHAPYGEECRDCWEADEGYVQVGCDADALELRDLAGYMARFDGGAYIETVLRGDKSQGTDMHTINASAIGSSRDTAKVFFYAMIYGSGDENLGLVLGVKKGRLAAGKKARAALMKAVPALGKLVEKVKKAVERGYIVGLDGRRLVARAENAALNTLLQSAGAVQMKRGLVILFDTLTAKGWEFGREYAIVALVHDEWQASVKPELAEEYGNHAAQAIRDAGTYYGFRCPLDGQFKVGRTWKETH